MIKMLRMPSLSRIAPGSKATLELPVGPTYNRIYFACTGTALAVAHIQRIDVLINGRVVQTYRNLQRLIDINSFYRRTVDTVNMWGLHFFQAQLADLVYRRAPGIGTADVQTFHIEIQLDATAPSNMTIEAFADLDPLPQPLAAFVNVRELVGNSATAGIVEIDRMPRGPWYTAIHVFKSDVTSVELEVDNGTGPVRIVNATKAILERQQRDASPEVRVPVTASATHIDFCTDGDLQNAIQTAGLADFRLKLTLGTSGAYDVIGESLDVLN